MKTTLIVSLIISLCQNDDRTYVVSEVETDCSSYYVNCIINKGSTDKAVEECQANVKSSLK